MPKRRKTFCCQLWRLFGGLMRFEVIEDDVKRDFVRPSILGTKYPWQWMLRVSCHELLNLSMTAIDNGL